MTFPASLSAWGKRAPIDIDATLVPATLSNHDVLISITSADLSSALASGADFRFVDADEETVLDYEIVTWDDVTPNRLLAYVKIPSLSSTTDTRIWVYWENASASDAQNAAGVFAPWVAVYHMQEVSAAVADTHRNSASATGTHDAHGGRHDFTGTPPTRIATGGATYGSVPNAERAQVFSDALATSIVAPGDTGWPEVGGTSQTTLVIHSDAQSDTSGPRLFGLTYGTGSGDQVAINMRSRAGTPGAGTYRNNARIAGAGDFTFGPDYTPFTWSFACVTAGGGVASTGYTGQIGVALETPATLGGVATFRASAPITYRTLGNVGVSYDRSYTGAVSEVRVGNFVASADQVETYFNNLSDPAGFVTVGTTESNAGGGGITLTDSGLTDGDTLPAETLSLGTPVSLTDSGLTDGDTLPAETLSLGTPVTLTDGALTDGDTLPTETLSVASGGVELTDGALVDADTLPAETLAAGPALSLTDGALTDADTLPGETLSLGSLSLTDGALVDGDTLPAESLTVDTPGVITLTDGSLVDADALPAETLTLGDSAVLTDAGLTDGDVLPAETLSLGNSLTLTDLALLDGDVLGAETVFSGVLIEAPVFADVVGVLARGGRLVGTLERGGQLDGELARGGRWIGKPGGY